MVKVTVGKWPEFKSLVSLFHGYAISTLSHWCKQVSLGKQVSRRGKELRKHANIWEDIYWPRTRYSGNKTKETTFLWPQNLVSLEEQPTKGSWILAESQWLESMWYALWKDKKRTGHWPRQWEPDGAFSLWKKERSWELRQKIWNKMSPEAICRRGIRSLNY